MASFELISADRGYTLTFGSTNGYGDGELRIEPPVHFGQDEWDLLHAETGVLLSRVKSGKEATVVHFFMDGVDASQGYENCARQLGDALLQRISTIESKESFVNQYGD